MAQRFFFESFQWSTIEASDDDDELIKFHVRCFGAHFQIQYRLHDLSLSPYLLKQFQDSLTLMKICELGDNLDAERALEEIHRLRQPFEELMIKLAPNPPPSYDYLSDYLYLPILILEAIATTQSSTAVQPNFKGELPRQSRVPIGQHISIWGHWLNVIIDDDREVLQHWPRPSKEDLYKKWGRDGCFQDWTDEQYADPNFDLKRLVGMLVYYIDNKGTLEEIAPQSDNEHQCRWATELESIVGELHSAGLVWGDAKPSNLLIDQNDQLWLIDLEGSYTPGWVDENNRESQKGDLQGVERIKEWLAKYDNKSTHCIGFGKNE
ncbi:hypothetical protein SS1G_04199 [Sclerotinia sclerotiorum 1980 UF-70]|uniref:Protein kinase domain-containing protein n=1 Tax=Sclerotinia sclerotiorum (strain ATCC 18683 / 1980 / Ss-1) TaxID=665079 RepID=A7EFV8_SCLS1|nr:hypothetical protein SS1G_04199 [Sclerotinia sclerotiorum 1980 UF-70]EDO01724.1 hypothetical protein SS1G_04199 [Sclerotinia sclerotiorum 1980 UF-70]